MKNAISTDALEKGLNALQAAAQAENPHARREELFQKAQNGTITEEEHGELLKSLGGGDDTLGGHMAGAVGGDSISKSIDVSDTLREFVEGTQEALRMVGDRMEKSESQDHAFKAAVATTLTAQGEILKSLVGAMESMGAMPARQPKSQGIATAGAGPIQKSFAGSDQPSDALSKSEILDGFEGLLAKGEMVVGGEDVTVAATRYESESKISRPMLARIKEFRNQQSA